MTIAYPEGSWIVSATPDRSIIVRTRDNVPGEDIRARYSCLMIVTWRYGQEGSGLPDAAINAELSKFDDAVEGLASESWFIDVAVVTGNGRKEWRFYARDAEEFAANFRSKLAPHARGGLVIEAFGDLDWTGLSELLPNKN